MLDLEGTLPNTHFTIVHQKTNHNEALLAELAEEEDFVISNVTFQKRKGKLWTFRDSRNVNWITNWLPTGLHLD